MVVVTGIITVAKIITRAAPIIYKYGQKNLAVAKYLYRHPRIAKYGTIAAASAPLIYDLLNIDYSAIPIPKFPKTNKVRQTRNNMVQSRSKRFQRTEHRPRCSCRFCRQRYRY